MGRISVDELLCLSINPVNHFDKIAAGLTLAFGQREKFEPRYSLATADDLVLATVPSDRLRAVAEKLRTAANELEDLAIANEEKALHEIPTVTGDVQEAVFV